MKERLEHVDQRVQPSMIRNHSDMTKIVPVLEPEHGVIRQRLKFKTCEILPDDIKHLDRAPSHHGFGLRDKRVAIIVVRYFATGFNREHVRRQALDEREHYSFPLRAEERQ